MAKPSRHDKRRARDAAPGSKQTVDPTPDLAQRAQVAARVDNFLLIVQILEAWHPGSGRGRGLQYDAIARRDEDGLPFLGGKHLRGLIREALVCLHAWGHVKSAETELRLFGSVRNQAAGSGMSVNRSIDLSRAELPAADRAALMHADAAASLFQGRYQIAMDGRHGVTRLRSLRSVEIVVPVTLVAQLTVRSDSRATAQHDIDTLKKAVSLVHAVGGHRTRGLGRARLSLEPMA